MTTTDTLPPIALSITFHVADYATWKKEFDSHDEARRQAGLLGHHICRSTDDPNVIQVFSPGSDLAKLKSFLASPDLAKWARGAGLLEAPAVTLLVPQEDRTIAGQYMAVLGVLEVEDYDRWKGFFDADSERRKRAGVVGYALSRSATDPGSIVAYLQIESIEKFQAVFGACDLNAKSKSGVRSSQFSFLDPQ